tara:strand:+ start:1267 stop:1455 length:189 start_codon:yes stop_codon:yes gene_type:complete
MKKLYPLLSVLFLIYWGCEDEDTTPTDVYDYDKKDAFEYGSASFTKKMQDPERFWITIDEDD